MLVAIPWREEADAIRMANDSHYGLAAYVWTHDIGSGLRAAHAIESGWVQVNQGLGQSPGHSYGGYKESGIGREFSLEGMLDSVSQRKNVTVNLNTPRRNWDRDAKADHREGIAVLTAAGTLRAYLPLLPDFRGAQAQPAAVCPV